MMDEKKESPQSGATDPGYQTVIEQDKDTNERVELQINGSNICTNSDVINSNSIRLEADKLLNCESPVKQVTLSDYDYLRITDSSPIPEPIPLITFQNEVFAVQEDIFGISGATKGGKSGIQNVFIACSISEDGKCADNHDTVYVSPNNLKHAVLHLDTEQSKHKHKKNHLLILKRAGLSITPKYFLSYNIRKLELDKYAETTQSICSAASNKFGGIHSIWIDGGADYVADVNDQLKSNEVIKFFEDLAISYKTAVFIIVHTNPGSDKERGHFGSQLQRKCGGLLSVKNDGETIIIEPKYLRYAGKGEFPLIQYKFDTSKGYFAAHYGNSILDSKQLKAEQKMLELWKLCKIIFSGQTSYNYNDALAKIQIRRACQERTAKGDFSLMHKSGMISQGDDGNYRINSNYTSELQ